MANRAILAVQILGDSEDAQRALKQLDTAVATSDANTKKSGRSMAGIWSTVAAATAACVRQASQLEQSTGAVEQIFGDLSDEVMTWAEGMSQYGISTAEAAQAAATLGGSLSSAGLSMEATAVLSTKLIELSADLVAVYGYSIPEALSAMGAAFRGEYDSLEKFNIQLTASTVTAEAQRLAAEGVTFASERQAQVVATLSLIYQQSIPIQTASEDEMDSMASTVSRAFAETKNLAAELGGHLLPVFQPLIDAFGETVAAVGGLIDEEGLLNSVTDGLVQILEDVWEIVEPILIPALELLDSIFQTISDFLDRYVIPVLDRVAEAFKIISDAVGDLIGWLQDALYWFNELIDDLTFWNDNFDPEAVPSASIAAARVTGLAVPAAIPSTVTVNVTAGIGDPHAIAKEVRRVLQRDAVRMGRR